MSTVYLVHGFNVKDGGRASVGRLRRGLQARGHEVRMIKYGFMQRLRVRGCTDGVAHTIASLIPPYSNVVAHSNGANVINRAAELGASFNRVWLINPALDDDIALPRTHKVHVFHAPSDPWTRLARFIPFSDWGRQGQIGYTGDSPRYTNTNLDALTGREVKHSGIFDRRRDRERLISIIDEELS